MAYTKTQWKDQVVENPRTYSMRDNGDDTVTLLDAFGTVTELGTPVNAENMNHIEDGIKNNESSITNLAATVDTKADNNAVVHTSGNETIAGTKTFSSTISGSINGNAATVTNGVYTTGNQTITGNKTFSGEVFYNRNDNQFRIISMTGNYGMIFRFDTSDNLYIFPTAQNDAYGSWDSASKGLVIEAPTGDVRAKGENGKGLVITDLGKNLSGSGYVKLSNGLIIAWGSFTYASGSGSVTVTLPQAMSSGSSYKVAVSFAVARAHTGAVSSQTSTSFTFNSSSFESSGTANYIAIGY